MNKKVDFIGIGAQKAGTTWLYENLSKIQEFDMPPIKELHYFDRSELYISISKLKITSFWQRITKFWYAKKAIRTIIRTFIKGLKTGNFKTFHFFRKLYLSTYNDKWYKSLFSKYTGYTGEITPAYMFLEEKDIQIIYKINPQIKIVFLLRNPIERAWSHYRFHNRNDSSFCVDEVDPAKIIEFMESKEQVLRSDYLGSIRNYHKYFNKDQILIGFYDAISDNPKELMKNILDHITNCEEISFNYLNLQEKVNVSPRINCPEEVMSHLKIKYHDQIKKLSEIYGGYCSLWYYNTYESKSRSHIKSKSVTIYS